MRLRQAMILFMVAFYLSNATGQETQDSVRIYLEHKNQLTEKGMYVLGGWGMANLATGLYGSITTDGWPQHFHEMNAFWGGVNLLIAYSAMRSVRRGTQHHPTEIQADMEWRKTRKLFLVNAGLDVLYIGSGVALMQWSNNLEKNASRVDAYGASFILQGGFLLGFDLTMYYLHSRLGKRELSPLLNRFSFYGNGFIYRFG